jgi:RNA polymerase sigma-70 factor (ECF subfamily)
MEKSANDNPSEAFIRALTDSQIALRGYCQASLGHSEEAKEALQRTSIVLWKKCDEWDPATAFLPWAITVAKFEVLGVIRDRKRDQKRFVFDSDIVALMVDEASDMMDSVSDRAAALEACLELLNDRNRETLAAYYVHGKSIQEIAFGQRKGTSALKVLLLRLRRKLGDCIQGRLARRGVV